MILTTQAVPDITLDIRYISLVVYVIQLIILTESETLGMGPSNLCFNKPPQLLFSSPSLPSGFYQILALLEIPKCL